MSPVCSHGPCAAVAYIKRVTQIASHFQPSNINDEQCGLVSKIHRLKSFIDPICLLMFAISVFVALRLLSPTCSLDGRHAPTLHVRLPYSSPTLIFRKEYLLQIPLLSLDARASRYRACIRTSLFSRCWISPRVQCTPPFDGGEPG